MPINETTRRTAVIAVYTLMLLFIGSGCSMVAYKESHGTSFHGTIQTVEASTRRLMVAPLKPGTAAVVFVWNDETRVWANGLRIEPTRLEPRDTVLIHYYERDGQWVVRHAYLQTHRTIH
ncbi:MAG: hypothetical protein ACYC23_20225 [Limisphaerales bacterium]